MVSMSGWSGTRASPAEVGSLNLKVNSPLWPGGMATCTSKLGCPFSTFVNAEVRLPLDVTLSSCAPLVAIRRNDVTIVPLGALSATAVNPCVPATSSGSGLSMVATLENLTVIVEFRMSPSQPSAAYSMSLSK